MPFEPDEQVSGFIPDKSSEFIPDEPGRPLVDVSSDFKVAEPESPIQKIVGVLGQIPRPPVKPSELGKIATLPQRAVEFPVRSRLEEPGERISKAVDSIGNTIVESRSGMPVARGISGGLIKGVSEMKLTPSALSQDVASALLLGAGSGVLKSGIPSLTRRAGFQRAGAFLRKPIGGQFLPAPKPGLSSEQVTERAATALKAISPGTTVDDSVSMVSEHLKMPKDMLLNGLGRGDPKLINAAKDVLSNVVPEKTVMFIKGVNPKADVGLVVRKLTDLFGEDYVGRFNTDADRNAAIKLISEQIGNSKNRQLRQLAKMVVQDFGLEDLSKVKKGDKIAPILTEIESLAKKGKLKDIDRFAEETLDFDRIGRIVDPTGVVNHRLIRPLFKAETRSMENTSKFIDKWNKDHPSVRPGSEESAVMQRFIENRLKLEDVVTPQIKMAVRESRNIYNEFLKNINDKLTGIIKKPIPFRKDYTTHFREIGVLDDFFGGIEKAPDPQQVLAREFGNPNSPFFKSALERLGGKFKDDAVGGMFRYVQGAEKILNLTDPVTSIRVNSRFLPNRANVMFNRFANDSMGKAVFPFAFEDTPVFKAIERGSQRFVANLIGGNIGTILAQPGSLATTVSEAGAGNALLGFMDLFSPTKRALAKSLSLVVRARLTSGTELIPKMAGKTPSLVDLPLQMMDENVSLHAFMSGIRKGVEKGLKGQSLIEFADTIANKANVLYLRSNTPRMIKSRVFRTLFPIQTFAFNQANFLGRDIVGALRRGEPEAVQRAIRFGSAILVLNGLYKGIRELTGSGVKTPLDLRDFIPLFFAFKTGSLGFPRELVQTITGQRPVSRLMFRLLLPRGGVQLERFLKGRVFPEERQ